jgi:hypothetical protein
MLHDRFRVADDRVQWQNAHKYNWDGVESPRYLAPAIIVSEEIELGLHESIRELVRQIAVAHDKPLQKVEVVRGFAPTEVSCRTILVRWTSSEGVYEAEFEIFQTAVTKVASYPRTVRSK